MHFKVDLPEGGCKGISLLEWSKIKSFVILLNIFLYVLLLSEEVLPPSLLHSSTLDIKLLSFSSSFLCKGLECFLLPFDSDWKVLTMQTECN